MAEKSTAPLFRPAIFGLGDGCMSIVGVVLYLLGDQRLIFPAALAARWMPGLFPEKSA